MARLLDRPALFLSGTARSRNYPANLYPFRAGSHYLYFGGPNQPGAALLVRDGRAELFFDFPTPEEAVWESVPFTQEELLERYELSAVRPRRELAEVLTGLDALSLGPCDPVAQGQVTSLLGRQGDPEGKLAAAVVEIRLRHDEAALESLRRAAEATVAAHLRAMETAAPGLLESQVLAAMMAEVIGRGMTTSFGPIVSVHGEVLHNPFYGNSLKAGDLLVVDFGAETEDGWAGDVTRTLPVDGRFTPEQKDVYQCVLAAQEAAIARVGPGRDYLEVHQTAARTLAEGLVCLGLLKGSVDGLVERGAHALFFPHGVGHLIGLDVHDMEDLGDLAGYAPGRRRSSQFGTCYLRLSRTLEPGMLVTVEPGFYWIPELLRDPQRMSGFSDCVDEEVLSRFREVRGIRIEDEVLVTQEGFEVLTASLPKSIQALERRLAATA